MLPSSNVWRKSWDFARFAGAQSLYYAARRLATHSAAAVRRQARDLPHEGHGGPADMFGAAAVGIAGREVERHRRIEAVREARADRRGVVVEVAAEPIVSAA